MSGDGHFFAAPREGDVAARRQGAQALDVREVEERAPVHAQKVRACEPGLELLQAEVGPHELFADAESHELALEHRVLEVSVREEPYLAAHRDGQAPEGRRSVRRAPSFGPRDARPRALDRQRKAVGVDRLEDVFTATEN